MRLVGLFSKKPKTDTRVASLRAKLDPTETEFTSTTGWEAIPGGRNEAQMVMIVTDRRVLWTYLKGPSDIVLDMLYSDAIAFIGSENEGGFILEGMTEPGHPTVLGRFRFEDRAAAVEIVRYVERSIPREARNLIPDFEGTGHHDRAPWAEDD